jgi:hypothetical protein
MLPGRAEAAPTVMVAQLKDIETLRFNDMLFEV